MCWYLTILPIHMYFWEFREFDGEMVCRLRQCGVQNCDVVGFSLKCCSAVLEIIWALNPALSFAYGFLREQDTHLVSLAWDRPCCVSRHSAAGREKLLLEARSMLSTHVSKHSGSSPVSNKARHFEATAPRVSCEGHAIPRVFILPV